MTDTALAPTTDPTTEHPTTLVALSPADVPAQQQRLRAWCQARITECDQERSDLLDNARIAKSNQWAFLSLERAAAKARKRVEYYQKILAAVDAGYLIVPNFDVEIMAVRVTKDRPRWRQADYDSAKVRLVQPELPPVGEGRYVDDEHEVEHREWTTPGKEGGVVKHERFTAIGFDDALEFPVLAAHPLVLDATGRAMALRIFDRIGVVTGRKEDPIVVGQIIDPREPYKWHQKPAKMVSFFVAWWFDMRKL